LTVANDDGTTKDIFLELNNQELGNLIASLSAANNVVKELQVWCGEGRWAVCLLNLFKQY